MRAILVRVEVPANASLGDKCVRTVQEVEVSENDEDICELIHCSSSFARAVAINDNHHAYHNHKAIFDDFGTGFITQTETTWCSHTPMPGSFIIKGFSDYASIDATISLVDVCEMLQRSVVANIGELRTVAEQIGKIGSCNYCGGSCIEGCSKLRHLSITTSSSTLIGHQQ